MRLRTALAAIPIVLLVWLGMGAYLVKRHNSEIAHVQQEAGSLAQAFEENIRRTVEAVDTTIRSVRAARARDPIGFYPVSWERESGLTSELTLQISISDRAGDMLASNLGPITDQRVSIADREQFRVPRDTAGDDLFISRPVSGAASRRWSVQLVRKLFDASGAFDGVIVASLDPAFLSCLYTSLDIGRGALLLLGRDGIVRSVGPSTAAGLGDNLSSMGFADPALVGTHGLVRARATMDGIERIYGWRRLDTYRLVVVAGLSIEDALAGYREDLKGCVAIGLGLTAIIVLVSAVLARNRLNGMRSRQVLRAAVDNISQGLMVIAADRRVPLLNARAVELLDLPPHLTLPGFEFDSLLEWQLEAGEFDDNGSAAERTLAESGGIERTNAVYRRTRRNGKVLEVRTKVLESGLAVRTFTDITEQEHDAHALADARDLAQAAARARSEFLAVMSHEIRTPLNGVIGVAALLEDTELGPAQRDYVRLLRQSGDHLLELINDILDFSRLEAERVELEEADFAPRTLLRSVVEMFLTQASAKDLHLSATTDDQAPAVVSGDPGRLRQILLNLVGNAVKFTDKGWISVTLTHEPAPDGCVKLLFSVADSGIGIEPEAIDRMFQEFTQMDGSISRRFGGSGLGLAICRRLVELMGGSITVQSRPGSGSTFRFDVAVRPAKAALPADMVGDIEPRPAPGMRILLAEDNPTNRIVALRMLERLGHRADVVGNGLEAIAALERTRYDLVLMDVMMPTMDGLIATRKIRAAEGAGARIAIVGLTAGSGPDNLTACLEAGMDAVTIKPVTPERLRAALADGLGRAGRNRPVGGPERSTSRLRELVDTLGEQAVAEIVCTFAEDTKANLETMKQAASSKDIQTTYRLAHSVTGAARNVGADALAERASTLEQTVGSLSTAQIAAKIAAMQAELDVVLSRLETGIEPTAQEVVG
jgi:signal transduction histidine kinase/DNA-binding response OmpR family regulator